jgi:CBS-domain-containing membrane protein
MSKDLITISPDKVIEDAARLMVKKGIEKLLVFDKGKMIGIITSTDILTIEPALFEILLERMKIDGGPTREDQVEFEECERCKKYSDDIEEVNGVYLCRECRSR